MSAPAADAPVTSPYDWARRAGRGADDWFRFQRAVNGFDPAEVLTPDDRERLMVLLVERWHWSDRQISSHTRWTLYTVQRIRERLSLRPCTGENTTVTPPEWTD
jgi:hypothetical protein